jgi:hypothetical protein
MKATSLTRRQRMFMEVAVFLFMCKRKFEIFALFIENKKSMFFIDYTVPTAMIVYILAVLC